MFHFYINLAYYLPHLYLFFRIKDQFISKKYNWLYIIIYLVMASVFPVTGLHPEGGNFFMEMLSKISHFLLPFYLYVFLSVLAFDLFLLINFAVKIISREKIKSCRFRLYALLSILLLSTGIVTAGAINLNTIRISRYHIEVPRKSSSIDHLTIAFIADAHIQEDFPLDFLDQFISKVNALHPDILLCGGDIVEGGRMNEKIEVIESRLRSIKTRYGVYAVLGNHEGYDRREPERFFRNAGMVLLKDSVIKIDSAFYLAGRNDKQFKRRRSIQGLIGNNTYNMPILLMDHRPTELQEISMTPVDVQFSGHTHNGQLFPLNFIIHSMYELSWGYRKIRNSHFFVTSGLRLWGPPIKTAGKAEIMLINMDFVTQTPTK